MICICSLLFTMMCFLGPKWPEVPLCVIAIHPGYQSRPVTSSQPANQRVERGEWGGALSEKAAQLNGGERNLNPKHCWTRAEWVKKHTRLQTHTSRTHTNPHRVSG